MITRLKNRFRGDSTIQHYKSYYKGLTYGPTNGKRLLMYVGIGNMYLTPVEVLMYHLFRSRGYEVDYVIYDRSIQINELITKDVTTSVGKRKFWNQSVQKATKILQAARVNYQVIDGADETYDRVVRQNLSLQDVLTYELGGVNFGNIVSGVMYRYYKSQEFGDDKLEIARKFLATSLTNYFFAKRKLAQHNYEYVLFSHGIYCTWQPVAELCVQSKVSYICYDRAKTKRHCNFNLNAPSAVWDISAEWKKRKNIPLSENQLDQVDAYLADRILQKGDVYAYNFQNKTTDLDGLKKQLNIKSGAKVLTVFTNLIWDAANVSRDLAFASTLECIRATILYFHERNDVHILVRPHPAERVLGTNDGYTEKILGLFPNGLPNNVSIIDHDLEVNAFSVMDITDIGIVHTSTVGIELAIEGKDVILISETHYRGKGFTHDVCTKTEYFNCIEEIMSEQLTIEAKVELAKKYFYIMMFEYQHVMPIETNALGNFSQYSHYNFQEFKELSDQPINRIIDRIGNGCGLVDFVF